MATQDTSTTANHNVPLSRWEARCQAWRQANADTRERCRQSYQHCLDHGLDHEEAVRIVSEIPGSETFFEDNAGGTNPVGGEEEENNRYFSWLGLDGEMDDLFYDDDDFKELHELFQLWHASGCSVSRRPKCFMDRKDWHKHAEEEIYMNTFQASYHMSPEEFSNLVEILGEDIQVDEDQSRRSTGGNDPIVPEVRLGTTLRFLNGGRVIDACRIYGISPGAAKSAISDCLYAIVNSKHKLLSICLPNPTDSTALFDLSRRWENLSTSCGLMRHHLLALDGWLPRTDAPSVPNPGDYYSGHYKCYGLNVQAAVGPSLEFMYFCIAGPGKTNDSRAFGRCKSFLEWLEKLPSEFFISADNAYINTRKVMTPHDRAQLGSSEAKRVYNYYLSQMRIRVEMAFGLLTTKYRILRHGLTCSNATNSLIISACATLHNYCIRSKEDDVFGCIEEGHVRTNPRDYGIEPLPHDGATHNMGFLEPVDEEEGNGGSSMLVSDYSRREELVDYITTMGLVRPEHNITRNSNA